jgi:hypothetical protein
MILEDDIIRALPPEPSFLTDYLDYAMRQTDAHVGYHLLSALAMLSQAAPIDLSVPLFGRALHANIYTLLVGPSRRAHKSTCVEIVGRIMRDAIEMKAPGSGAPYLKQFIAVHPASEEALVDSFYVQPKQILLYEEYGRFLTSTAGDASYNAGAKLRTALTDVFDATTIGRARVGKKAQNVTNPRMSILAAVATSFLESNTTITDWTGGFFGRFLVCYPGNDFYTQGFARVQDSLDEDEDARSTRENLVKGFLAMALRTSKFSPCIGMDADSKAIWKEWEPYRTDKAANANPLVQAAIHGSDTIVLKIALLLALNRGRPYEGQPWRISRVEMESAMQITDVHIRSLEALGDAIVFGSRDMQDRRNVLFALRDAAPKPLTLGEIAMKANLLIDKRLNIILQTLTQQTLIGVNRVGNTTGYVLREAGVAAVNAAGAQVEAARRVEATEE